MRKIPLSVRINPFNYDMIKAVGDMMFLNERRNDGDLSKSLDWILSTFRTNSEFSPLISLLISYSRFERGSRSKIDVEKTRQLLALLKSLESSIV